MPSRPHRGTMAADLSVATTGSPLRYGCGDVLYQRDGDPRDRSGRLSRNAWRIDDPVRCGHNSAASACRSDHASAALPRTWLCGRRRSQTMCATGSMPSLNDPDIARSNSARSLSPCSRWPAASDRRLPRHRDRPHRRPHRQEAPHDRRLLTVERNAARMPDVARGTGQLQQPVTKADLIPVDRP